MIPIRIALEQAILVDRCSNTAIRGVHVKSPGNAKNLRWKWMYTDSGSINGYQKLA